MRAHDDHLQPFPSRSDPTTSVDAPTAGEETAAVVDGLVQEVGRARMLAMWRAAIAEVADVAQAEHERRRPAAVGWRQSDPWA